MDQNLWSIVINLCTIQELQSKNGVNPASRKSIARLQKGDGAMSNYKAY